MGILPLEVGHVQRKRTSSRVDLVLALAIFALSSCGADYSSQIVDLQKQIALLSRQIEDIQKEMHILRDAGANVQQALHNAEAEINRLKTLETLPGGAMRGSLQEEDLTTVMPVQVPGAMQEISPQKTRTTVTEQKRAGSLSCSLVWSLLGKGQGTKEVAKVLRTSVEEVQFCEQKVGRNTVNR